MRRWAGRSEEHTSELQSPDQLVCRLLLEKKKRPTWPTSSRSSAAPGAGTRRRSPRSSHRPRLPAQDGEDHAPVRAELAGRLWGGEPHVDPVADDAVSGVFGLVHPGHPLDQQARPERDHFLFNIHRPPTPTLFPYTTLFR